MTRQLVYWVEKDTYQVELLLKLLICIINAKLFKAVDIKCFKPEDKFMFKLNKYVWLSVEHKTKKQQHAHTKTYP